MRLRLLLLALLAAAAACGDGPTPPREISYGFFNLGAEARGDGYVTRPIAVFYSTTPLVIPTSHISRDSCRVQRYVPGETGDPVFVEFIDVGESVGLQLGGTAAALARRTSDTLLYYAPATDTVAFTPGVTATFTVRASEAFPATTVSSKTAEAFTFDPVPVPSAGAGIPLGWTPPADTGSKLVVSLRYATPGSAVLDQQIYCNLLDDGSYVIRSELAGGWRNSHGGRREAIATRWRTTEELVEDAIVQVVSTFRVPTPAVP